MKKKGLIVATIVMVLVLAVSLTTATYAWFTADANTTVSNITVAAKNAGEVLIGVSTTGKYVNDATDTNFVSGDIETVGTGATEWVGEPGMGNYVDTRLALSSISKAVSTGSAAAPEGATAWAGTADAPADQLANTYFIKAAGDGNKIANSTETGGFTVEAATENTDYLHFTLGMLATLENIDTITLTITIQGASDHGTIMGVTNALHLLYKVNNESTWKNIDIGGSANKYSTKIEDHKVYYVNGVQQGEAKNLQTAGSTVIEITIGTPGAKLGTTAENIQQVEIYLYYVGTDTDCVTAGLGTNATISFEVTNTNEATA